MTIRTRTHLNEAAARRLVHSFQRAKPARLVPEATGRFRARVFRRDTKWLAAAVCDPGQ